MLPAHVVWDLPSDPDGNVQHVAQHGLTTTDVETVLFGEDSSTEISKTSGLLKTFGDTPGGVHIAVVWEHVGDDPLTMRPITAYPVPSPRRPRKSRKKP